MKSNCCKNEKTKNELDDLVGFLKIISEENRLRILCLLQQGELCVYEIWEYLELSQNLVSHHLRVLREIGLIESRKEGTHVIYSLNSKNTKKYSTLLSQFI